MLLQELHSSRNLDCHIDQNVRPVLQLTMFAKVLKETTYNRQPKEKKRKWLRLKNTGRLKLMPLAKEKKDETACKIKKGEREREEGVGEEEEVEEERALLFAKKKNTPELQKTLSFALELSTFTVFDHSDEA